MIITVIVGTHQRGQPAVAALSKLRKGARLALKRDRQNLYDRNAIAVYAGPQHLGFVPRTCNAELAQTLDRDGEESLVAILTAEAIIERGVIKFAPKIAIREIS